MSEDGHRDLDAVLGAWKAAAPNAALRAAVVAGAPRRLQWRNLAAGVGLGLGLAAAGAAGVAAGLLLAPPSVTRLIGGGAAAPADDVAALLAPANEARGA